MDVSPWNSRLLTIVRARLNLDMKDASAEEQKIE